MVAENLPPLGVRSQVARSVILVLLLVGNLFPTIGGWSLATLASFVTTPVLVYEIFRWFPRLAPVLTFTVPIFGLFGLHMILVPYTTSYGSEKMIVWLTATFLTATAASLLRDEPMIHVFASVWLLAGVVLSVVAVTGFAGGRATAFGANPIWLGRAIEVALIALVWIASRGRIEVRWAMPAGILLVAALAATGARGPLIAAGVGVIIVVVFSSRRPIRDSLGMVAGALVLYSMVVTLPFFAQSRLNQILAGGIDDPARSQFWESTLDLIPREPFGVGVGNWAVSVSYSGRSNYPHNLFLEVFAEFGTFLGVALLLLVMYVGVRLIKAAHQNPTAAFVLGAFTAELVNVSLSGDLNARVFWFFFTLAYLVGSGFLLPTEPGKLLAPRSTRLRSGIASTHHSRR